MKTHLRVFFPLQRHCSTGVCTTKDYNRDVFQRLWDSDRWKRTELHASGECKLHHDNLHAHSAQLLLQFLAKNKLEHFQQLLYSSDVTPKIKPQLKGTRLQDVDEIQTNGTRRVFAILTK